MQTTLGRRIAPFIAWCLLGSFSAKADVLKDVSGGDQWPGYGRTYDEGHYSPLTEINSSNVSRLGLVWSFDIPGVVLAASVPLEVNGRLYFATGYSVVRAVDSTDGHLLWTFDPEVYRFAGRKMRVLYGIRGIAYWHEKVYVGTHDGRLICVDASSGKPVWTVSTTQPGDYRIITGPPLVFDGKVAIGHGVAEYGRTRGYITTYDAETGRQLWRFFTVPGNPSKGFENAAMKMAARTWSGQWWKAGGGGTVWNAMTYDRDLHQIYIGTGNGSPTNAATRSPQGGDNLFVACLVALDADSGAYKWHYQINPAETWDFDATEDIELAKLTIAGVQRRVLMQASKNGFFYVLDRATGQLISAEKFATATWADRIDPQTGRPVEAAGARDFSSGAMIWPSVIGAHSFQPMAFSPRSGLVYIPVLDRSEGYRANASDTTEGMGALWRKRFATSLLAWNPVEQRAAWRVNQPGSWVAGAAATAGNLVFQGRSDGIFAAYAADTGQQLWSFDSQTGIVGAPMTYKVAGRQYVSVMTGFSGVGSVWGAKWNAYTQHRRLLTFALGGTGKLPAPVAQVPIAAVPDPEFIPNARAEQEGQNIWSANHCEICHGDQAVAGGAAPDLRASAAIVSAGTFRSIVKDGALLEGGMPRFEDLNGRQLEMLRHYLRGRALLARTSGPSETH